MKKKTLAAVAIATTALICFGAFSGAYAAENTIQPPPGFLTAEQTLAEFSQMGTSSGLTLPEGVKWPQTPPPALKDTEGAFQVGYVKSVAKLYWLCAWEETIVDAAATRNVQSQSEGRGKLESFAKSTWFTQNDVDPDGVWRETVLKPALSGDLSGVVEELASCGYFHANQK